MSQQHRHLKEQAHRAKPFGISETAILKMAYRVGDAMREKGIRAGLVIVKESRDIKRVGESNGHYLCIIIRHYMPHTILLRRKGQRQLDGLPPCRYSPRWDCITQ